ncbi:hypothetical protein MT325_m579L [Paramecium bursaria chlorella virus MT325]|uniref:Uncharacterized protein m579L n=1 Tax=Paramecium bursaria Chlorella virus MT325 TaxID=346932 RepID=A7IUV9_PBCVM|nr:hypothetical protein MT325_m579L [Paramecium bursaria chlorella virus MT325]
MSTRLRKFSRETILSDCCLMRWKRFLCLTSTNQTMIPISILRIPMYPLLIEVHFLMSTPLVISFDALGVSSDFPHMV